MRSSEALHVYMSRELIPNLNAKPYIWNSENTNGFQ